MAKTLAELAELMKDIDFAMFSTHTENGAIASRPMSNNAQVEYDGDNYFFALDSTRVVTDIRANPNVSLGFQGKGGLLGMKPRFVAIEGRADSAARRVHGSEPREKARERERERERRRGSERTDHEREQDE